MAKTTPTSLTDMWNYLLDRRAFALSRLRSNGADANQMYAVAAACEETMLGLNAPELKFVRAKLGLLWSSRLSGHDVPSRRRLLVLDDLRELDPEYLGDINELIDFT